MPSLLFGIFFIISGCIIIFKQNVYQSSAEILRKPYVNKGKGLNTPYVKINCMQTGKGLLLICVQRKHIYRF